MKGILSVIPRTFPLLLSLYNCWLVVDVVAVCCQLPEDKETQRHLTRNQEGTKKQMKKKKLVLTSSRSLG